jgi:hypothetical protein
LGLYAGMRPHERVEVLLAVLGSQQRVILPRSSIELAPLSRFPKLTSDLRVNEYALAQKI